MKQMIFLASLIVFLAATAFAREKVDAPFWNPGDKWVFPREGPEGNDFGKYRYEKGYNERLIEEKGARKHWELVSWELKK